MFQTKVSDKIKNILCSVTFFPTTAPFMRKSWKIFPSRKAHRWQYGACGLHAG